MLGRELVSEQNSNHPLIIWTYRHKIVGSFDVVLPGTTNDFTIAVSDQ